MRPKRRHVNPYIPLKIARYARIHYQQVNCSRFYEKKREKPMKTKVSKFKPFVLVTVEKTDNEEQYVIIVAGNTQVSPLHFKNEEEAEQYLTEQPYEMFTNLYSIFKYYENEQNKKATKEVAENKKKDV